MYDAFFFHLNRLLNFKSRTFLSLWFLCVITQFRCCFFFLSAYLVFPEPLQTSCIHNISWQVVLSVCVKQCFLLLTLNLPPATLILLLNVSCTGRDSEQLTPAAILAILLVSFFLQFPGCLFLNYTIRLIKAVPPLWSALLPFFELFPIICFLRWENQICN